MVSMQKDKEEKPSPTVDDDRPVSNLKRISEDGPSPVAVETNQAGETVVSFTEPRRRSSSLKLERTSFRNHNAYGGMGHLAN